jgi:hypothetical protein
MERSESYNLRDVSYGGTVIDRSDVARFWAKVRRSGPDACWLWTASTWRNGYGQFRVQLPGGAGKQKTCGAHQVAYAVSHGSIPLGAHVLHKCDVKRCCNPQHLFVGTHADNMRDASAKGRLSVQRPSGQKVTDEQIAEMVELRRSGLTLEAIAGRFDVSRSYVSFIVRGLRRQYRPQVAQRVAS